MMVLGSMSALADAETTIKIGSAASGYPSSTDMVTADLTGHTFNVYKILTAESESSGTYSNLTWGSDALKNAAGTLLSTLKSNSSFGSFFSAYTTGTPADGQKAFTAASFTQVISDTSFGAENLKALADTLKDFCVSNSIGATAVKQGTTTTLPGPGYYVVDDTTENPADKVMNPVVLFAVAGTTNEIQIKAEKPFVVKKIDGSKDDDAASTGLVDADTASIGQKIPYDIRSKVPNMEYYEKYYMEFSDTLSQGLTYDANSLKVTVGGQELVADTDYTLTVSPATKDLTKKEDTAISVKIADLKAVAAKYSKSAGAEVIVTYTATVNTNAVIGETGNPNTVKIIYSRDPDKSGNGTPGTPDHPTGETPEDTVITYLTGFDVLKVDGKTSQALAGAKFTLTGTMVKTVLVTGTYFDEVTSGGTYWLLKDGTYTTTEPTDQTKDAYVDPSNAGKKYAKTVYTKDAPKIIETTESVSAEAVSAGDGHLTFSGLGAGQYTFTEIEAPTGYNKLTDPIKLTVACTTPTTVAAKTDKATWSVTAKEGLSGNVTWDAGKQALCFTVENNSGATLPETGGVGTTLFYVAGSIMVLAAAILLITKRRMGNND